MSCKDKYIRWLREFHPLREPMLHEAIRSLKIPGDSLGLDAGCGICHPTLVLAEAAGLSGHVIGLDISIETLLHGREVVEESRLSGHVFLLAGNIRKLPFKDKVFDWVWSEDCAGYPTDDEPLSLLKGLSRVVKPGGIVAIIAWSSQQLLPGFPLLEARLNATSGIAPYVKGKRPETHFLRALGWFQAAGLVYPGVKTFIGDVHSPLSQEIRRALISLFKMLWEEPQSEISAEDQLEYQRLCHPESPDFILDLPDYYAFFTSTMFYGSVPDESPTA